MKVTDVYEIKNALKKNIILAFPEWCSDIDISDNRFPAVICTTCHRKLYKIVAGEKIESLKIPAEYKNYPAYKQIFTRGSAITKKTCTCGICEILLNYGTVHNNLLKKPFKKALKKPIIERRCDDCYNIIGKGIRHQCSSKNKQLNLKKSY